MDVAWSPAPSSKPTAARTSSLDARVAAQQTWHIHLHFFASGDTIYCVPHACRQYQYSAWAGRQPKASVPLLRRRGHNGEVLRLGVQQSDPTLPRPLGVGVWHVWGACIGVFLRRAVLVPEELRPAFVGSCDSCPCRCLFCLLCLLCACPLPVGSAVHSVATHPTLDVLLTTGRDSSVRVWDMRTKSQVHCLTGHTNTTACVLARGTDPQVISGSHDSTIRLWDLTAGKTLASDLGVSRACQCVVWVKYIDLVPLTAGETLASEQPFVASGS